jgi:hypothetical protein
MMDVKRDRRQILPMMRAHFQSLDENITSDDLHGFLNAQTGLDIPLNETNGIAFDAWRQALAAVGVPVWGYTAEQIADVKRRGEALKAKEDERKRNLPELLKALAKEAPGEALANP